MKIKLTLSLFSLIFLFNANLIAQEIQQTAKTRPADFEYMSAPDSAGVRHSLKMPKLAGRNTDSGQLKLPYPIIFIHGLDSNSNIWNTTTDFMDATYQFTYGGRFDFCLNYDGDYYNANKNIYPVAGADIAQFTTTLTAGDYYYLNYDVGIDGIFNPGSATSNVLSNQSAVVKQGIVLQRVIAKVMQLTGRDKVILMGHSMGGLASREYLQNPSNWQEPFTNHHVAKLVTTGTPHGGSNLSASIFGAFVGIYERSEAVRDLRTSYYYSNAPGVFLSGGVENNAVMDDMLATTFYNVDVNCDGLIGENVVGLNSRSFANVLDLDYSCIIGTVNSGTSDGVVTNYSADLSNFCPSSVHVNKFNYAANSAVQVHTDLPAQIYQNMQGLDEPNEMALAYQVDTNKTYSGFTTVQSDMAASDSDYYKFTLTGQSTVLVSINNIHTSHILAGLGNSAGSSVGNLVPNNGSTSINFSMNLSAGTYYLLIGSLFPGTSDYLYPYTFSIGSTLGISDFSANDALKFYPNPTNSKVFFDNSNNNFTAASVINCLGQEVSRVNFKSVLNNQEIDLSGFPDGVYILKMSSSGETKTVKIIKQ